MELTARLRAVADLIPQGGRLADVGTDHAYLPVWLLLRGRISQAIASDLREGPLARARETARQYHVEQYMDFRLCDGLSAIRPEETDAVAIAGMGGETIAAILGRAPWTREKHLVLQPMTSFPELRLWLQQNGYKILKEHTAREGKRLYTIWSVRGGSMLPLSAGELWAGRQGREDPLRKDYLDEMAGKLRRALRGQLTARTPDEGEVRRLRQALDDIMRMQKEL